jgi:hypothetical protein
VMPGLASQLRETRIRGLHGEDIRLPFKSIYIVVPPQADLWLEASGPSNPEGKLPLTGVYVSEGVDPSNKDIRALDVLLIGGQPRYASMETAARFAVPLKPGVKIDDTLQELNSFYHSRAASTPILGFSSMVTLWLSNFRWILNAIIYATWPEAERREVWLNGAAKKLWEKREAAPKGKKRDELSTKLRSMDQRKRILLGEGIAIIDRHTPVTSGRMSTDNKRTLNTRTLVQGHWKRYATGKGRTERTWIWRAPFWRGPKDAETVFGTEHLLR